MIKTDKGKGNLVTDFNKINSLSFRWIMKLGLTDGLRKDLNINYSYFDKYFKIKEDLILKKVDTESLSKDSIYKLNVIRDTDKGKDSKIKPKYLTILIK